MSRVSLAGHLHIRRPIGNSCYCFPRALRAEMESLLHNKGTFIGWGAARGGRKKARLPIIDDHVVLTLHVLILFFLCFSFAVEDMEQYLHYIGGGAGALALTGVAAASAFYLASRPSSERLLWPNEDQTIIEVSSEFFLF